jgi:ribA/ribD-fused uncharacterized protein
MAEKICLLPGCNKIVKNINFDFCEKNHHIKYAKYLKLVNGRKEYLSKLYTDQMLENLKNGNVLFYIKSTDTLIKSFVSNIAYDWDNYETDYFPLSYYYKQNSKIKIFIDNDEHNFRNFEELMYYGRFVGNKEIINLFKNNPDKIREIAKKNINKTNKNWDNGGDLEWSLISLLAIFTQNENKKKLLLSTKNRKIVEASPFDSRWSGFDIVNKKGIIETGQNNSGIILMEVRKIISEKKDDEIDKLMKEKIDIYIKNANK